MAPRAESVAECLAAAVVALDADNFHLYTKDDILRLPALASDSESGRSHTLPNTPIIKSIHRSGAPILDPTMLKKILHHELSGGYKDLKDFLPSSVYATIEGVDTDAIESYLRRTIHYDSRTQRWDLPCDSSPSTPFLEKNLYEPFKKIISDIIEHFKVDSVLVEDTHNKYMIHLEDYLEVYVDTKDNEIQLKTAPDLCIMGKGAMFRPAALEVYPSYFHCQSPVELKTTRSISFKDVTIQVAAYVR